MTPSAPDRPYVFISFSDEGKDAKDALYAMLTNAGIKPWTYHEYSRDGLATQNYLSAIEADRCKAVIGLISSEVIEKSSAVVTELNTAIAVASAKKIKYWDFLFLVSLQGVNSEILDPLRECLKREVPGASNTLIVSPLRIPLDLVPRLMQIPGLLDPDRHSLGDQPISNAASESSLSPKQILAGLYTGALRILNPINYDDVRAMSRRSDGSNLPDGTKPPDFANAMVDDTHLASDVKQAAAFYLGHTRAEEDKENLRVFLSEYERIKRPEDGRGEIIDTKYLESIPPAEMFPLGQGTARDLASHLFDRKQPIAVIVNADGTLYGIVTHLDLLNKKPAPEAKIEIGLPCINDKPVTAKLGEPMQEACEKITGHKLKKLLVADSENRPAGLLTSETAEGWLFANT